MLTFEQDQSEVQTGLPRRVAVVTATRSVSSSPLCIATQRPAQFADAVRQSLLQGLVQCAEGEGEGEGEKE